MAERAPSPVRHGGPHGGRDVLGVARGRGGYGGREGEREADAGPAAAALPQSPSLGPRPGPSPISSGAGTGGREGERRAALCNRRAGPRLPARGRAEGDTGTDP